MACMFCTRCGKCAVVKGKADFGRCPLCGTPYAGDEAKCPKCHAPRIVAPGAGGAGSGASGARAVSDGTDSKAGTRAVGDDVDSEAAACGEKAAFEGPGEGAVQA